MSDISRLTQALSAIKARFLNKRGEFQVKTSDLDKKILEVEGTKKLTVSDEAPINPQIGDIWIDTTEL